MRSPQARRRYFLCLAATTTQSHWNKSWFGRPNLKYSSVLVYLFATDGSRVFLSLNQGTESMQWGLAPLQKRALDLRTAAGNPPGLGREFRPGVNQRPRRYEAGSALANSYERGSVLEDSQIVSQSPADAE